MRENEVAALMRGMAPGIRQAVTKAVHDSVAEAVTRATVPPELATEVAAAVRMLHESPPVVARNDVAPVPPLPRVTRIERDDDGNLVPVYEPQP